MSLCQPLPPGDGALPPGATAAGRGWRGARSGVLSLQLKGPKGQKNEEAAFQAPDLGLLGLFFEELLKIQ
jgi:hypothetical protein